MVKTLPSSPGGVGLIPGQGINIPHALRPKNQNISNKSNIVTNSIKTLKIAHIKKLKKIFFTLAHFLFSVTIALGILVLLAI